MKPPPMDRRAFLSAALGAVALGLTGCAQDETPAEALALTAALPAAVPNGTKLVVGDKEHQKAIEFSGAAKGLTFEVEWANLSGGPQTLEAFRARALDIGSVADIPPIHSHWTGIPTKIVASKFRQDPLNHAIYRLGIAPGTSVATLADIRGKKVAYSPGQAQGALVLRVLHKAGLTKQDVELVELPSTGDVYANALASRQVDVAPIGGVQVKRYETKYGKDGATTIAHGLRDDPGHLYAPITVLADPAKAAAIREYVQVWARAWRWREANPDEWIERYYVKDQGLTTEDGRWIVANAGVADIPPTWTEAIARHQETIDLLAKETGNKPLKAEDLYDRRYETVAADALAAGGAR
ncbi:ABC transporter substrate-binding protein [Catellatospora citrea]|uniref:ABC transporter substrate-binding protein n=1 Tax=Catellatospora citrea TaxID=53366 RepID=A0A8J3K7V2_9ACTN|nr:ABC transporter substrate-binding protein [Catellatospora citrea]RKE00442.1 sulfonate transport system substrate-binding protein [Catellatospora citrea]GIF98102.1 ABC transporter substrate-binding protein [Catellatospora citrea]